MHVLVKKFIVKEFSIKQPKSHHKCQMFIIKKNSDFRKNPKMLMLRSRHNMSVLTFEKIYFIELLETRKRQRLNSCCYFWKTQP